MQNFTRRELLKLGAATTIAELASLGLHGCGGVSVTPPLVPTACSKLTDIEHVVILIQENRSFDHYFGSYRGVRGFSDQSMAFQQPDPANTTISPVGTLLPFHLDTSTTNAECTHDISHDWVPQHQSWHSGAMDGFVDARLSINSSDAVLCMGYYARADIPGEDGETKTDASDGYVPLHPVLAGHLRAWQRHTPHAEETDFVFPSMRAGGRKPLCSSVFVADYLRPAAKNAGVHIEDGQRFGLHNLRHSLSNWLVNKAKVQPKTVQGILRHAKIQTTLDLYTQEDSDETRAAQGEFLNAVGMSTTVN